MKRGPEQSLSVFDACCLIVGIIVGAGIYETSPLVASSVAGEWAVLGLWLVGGLISFCGAICYAELATTYPDDGGDVVYLRRAYGPWAGFLFGWMQMLIVRPGDIALMAFIFAKYAAAVLNVFGQHWLDHQPLGAIVAVLLLTGVNWLGIREAAVVQNVLTVGKILGLIGILLVGFWTAPKAPSAATSGPPNAIASSTVAPSSPVAPSRPEATSNTETSSAAPTAVSATSGSASKATPEETSGSFGISVGVALVMVLFCYGGWNEMAYVAAEVRDPRKNILRAMVGGLGLVMFLYLLANLAFMKSLGKDGFERTSLVAVEVVARYLPNSAGTAVALLIAISSLGAINGLMLAGARIAYAVGQNYPLFSWLGQWDERRQTPVVALFVQTAITLVIIIGLGSFRDTLIYTAPTVYLFYSFTSATVWILRRKDPSTPRAFNHWGFPLTVVVFIVACVYMTYSAVLYRPNVALFSLCLLLTGLPVYWLSRSVRRDWAS